MNRLYEATIAANESDTQVHAKKGFAENEAKNREH